MDVSQEQRQLRQFAKDRDWDQFHSPKNLAMALAGEAGELLELFQWLTEDQSRQVMSDGAAAERVRHELADITAYLLRIADVLDIDLAEALQAKLRLNDSRYPIDLARGNATKYTDLG